MSGEGPLQLIVPTYISISISIFVLFDLPKMKLVEGIAELFHRVFYLKDRKVAVTDHV